MLLIVLCKKNHENIAQGCNRKELVTKLALQLISKFGSYAQDVAVISSGNLAINGGTHSILVMALGNTVTNSLLISAAGIPIKETQSNYEINTSFIVMQRTKKSELFGWQTLTCGRIA